MFLDSKFVREPNLLVPGRKPIGPVEISNEYLRAKFSGSNGFVVVSGSVPKTMDGDSYTLKNNAVLSRNALNTTATAAHISQTADYAGTFLDVPAGSDLTIFLHFGSIQFEGVNPGIIRSGSTAAGADFFTIVQGSNQLPWIRWAGGDILRPSSGRAVQSGDAVIYRVKNQSSASVFINGVREHHATHVVNKSGSQGIHLIGYQASNNQRVYGEYKLIAGTTSYLDDAVCRYLTRNPYQFLIPA